MYLKMKKEVESTEEYLKLQSIIDKQIENIEKKEQLHALENEQEIEQGESKETEDSHYRTMIKNITKFFMRKH